MRTRGRRVRSCREVLLKQAADGVANLLQIVVVQGRAGNTLEVSRGGKLFGTALYSKEATTGPEAGKGCEGQWWTVVDTQDWDWCFYSSSLSGPPGVVTGLKTPGKIEGSSPSSKAWA